MGWFEHRHTWLPMTSVNQIIDHDSKMAKAALVIEKCSCGAVRTLEVTPGEAPVIRMGVLS